MGSSSFEFVDYLLLEVRGESIRSPDLLRELYRRFGTSVPGAQLDVVINWEDQMLSDQLAVEVPHDD